MDGFPSHEWNYPYHMNYITTNISQLPGQYHLELQLEEPVRRMAKWAVKEHKIFLAAMNWLSRKGIVTKNASQEPTGTASYRYSTKRKTRIGQSPN
ncbi:Hypothetical predicted protein [Olea europaea subsp. europaea]|uniref:Uncharacterized protein n=1 Tax=Olea europaea subsp. europaea TaxID=158383 RepID=A0A8S0PIA8_OLEEU|nr:Hypothetical predicted protein [Olea europaea subsp. europaea]